jgi:hypothetical protein
MIVGKIVLFGINEWIPMPNEKSMNFKIIKAKKVQIALGLEISFIAV